MSRYINDDYKNLVELSKFPIGWFLPAGVIEIVENHNKKHFNGASFHKSLMTMIVEYCKIDQQAESLADYKKIVENQQKTLEINQKLIEKLKLEISDLKSKMKDGVVEVPKEKLKHPMRIESNIYKNNLGYRVNIEVHGEVRSKRFDTLKEAKAFKEQCVFERSLPKVVPAASKPVAQKTYELLENAIKSDDDLEDLNAVLR